MNNQKSKMMKYLAAALIITAVAFTGCESTPTMTMTTVKEGEVMFRMAGTGTAVIDWDYGTAPETVILSGNAAGKTIYIDNNPGADGCDRGIAADKGWTVRVWNMGFPPV